MSNDISWFNDFVIDPSPYPLIELINQRNQKIIVKVEFRCMQEFLASDNSEMLSL